MRILKVFSVLLCYPSTELQAAMPEIQRLVADDEVLDDRHKEALQPLLHELAHDDIYDLQERYVFLFDRSRSLCLNLFEHIHGESRDRGSAMVDLLQAYEAAGFALQSSELPDHLPVLLEFLSTQPPAEARATLLDAGAILVALSKRLQKRQTPYAAILQALVDIAQADKADEQAQQLIAEKMDNPNDLEALDAVWEETAVTFGPESLDSCSGMLARSAPTGDLHAAEAMMRQQLAHPAMPGVALQQRGDTPSPNEFPIFIQAAATTSTAKGGDNV